MSTRRCCRAYCESSIINKTETRSRLPHFLWGRHALRYFYSATLTVAVPPPFCAGRAPIQVLNFSESCSQRARAKARHRKWPTAPDDIGIQVRCKPSSNDNNRPYFFASLFHLLLFYPGECRGTLLRASGWRRFAFKENPSFLGTLIAR